MTGGELEPLRASHARRSADEWVLVLGSQGIGCVLRAERGHWVLWVASAERAAAELALERWTAENAQEPRPLRPLPLGDGLAGVWVGSALALFALITGPATGGARWFQRGTAHAAALLGGEPWRALTALTLHVDAAHVIANAVSAAVFVTWVCRRLGSGVGLSAVLVAGALGNLANALWQGGAHRSVGASTALFGALGVLSGLEAGLQWQAGVRVARAWLPLAAGLALLAMLGTGRGSDMGAHVFGLLAGAALGVPLARVAAHPPRARTQWLAGSAALGALLWAWWLALSG